MEFSLSENSCVFTSEGLSCGATSDVTSKNLRYLSTKSGLEEREIQPKSTLILNFKSSQKPTRYCSMLICLKWHLNHGKFHVTTPERPQGQQELLADS